MLINFKKLLEKSILLQCDSVVQLPYYDNWFTSAGTH